MTRDAMVRKLHARIAMLAQQSDDEAEALYMRVFPDAAERARHEADERALSECRVYQPVWEPHVAPTIQGYVRVEDMSDEEAAALLAALMEVP